MDGDGEFTFAVVPPVVADTGGGVFRSGSVGTSWYPVFGRPRSPPRPPEPEPATVPVPLARLLQLVDDKEPSPARPPDDDDDLDSVPADMYCPWSPGWSAASPAAARRRMKSASTGSILRWRPRLVRRSQSDGKERLFVFFNTGAASRSSSHQRRKVSTRRNGEVTGAGSGHAWSYYDAKGSRGGNNGARRTSFLPYKQDLVGLFANAAVFRRGYLSSF